MKTCPNCGYNNDAEIDTEARCARCNFDGKLPEDSEVSGNLPEDEPFLIKQTASRGQMQRASLPPGEVAAPPALAKAPAEQQLAEAPAKKQPEAEVV